MNIYFRYNLLFIIIIQYFIIIQASEWKNRLLEKRNIKSSSILGKISKNCGVRLFTKIVGGTEVTPKSWPWMAALLNKKTKKIFCGGCLITPKHILTAAHCLEGLLPRDIIVRLGAHDISDHADPDAKDFSAYLFKIHANYQHRPPFPNDIAIIELKENSDVGDCICLPLSNRNYENKIATVIGWGFTEAGGATSSELRQVDLAIWKNERCREILPTMPNKTICAGGEENKDSCQGDSGGPLMVESSNNRWSVNGIVSTGGRCGDSSVPGIYTNVADFLQWLDIEVGSEIDLLTRLDQFISKAEWGRDKAKHFREIYDASNESLRRSIKSYINEPKWFKEKTKLCFEWHSESGKDQCSASSNSLCTGPNEFTDIYEDGSDYRPGGCIMKWGILSEVSPSWFKEVRICYQYLAQSSPSECIGSSSLYHCAKVGEITMDYLDDTKGKNGCLLSWSLYVPKNSPGWAVNLRLCLRWTGSEQFCGLGAKETICAYANKWTAFYRDNSGRGHKCQLSWAILTWDY